MAAAIAQQPPEKRDKRTSGKLVFPLEKFAFFDENSEKMYNIIANTKSIVDFADFSITILPYMVMRSSKRHSTPLLNGITLYRIGMIANRGPGQ